MSILIKGMKMPTSCRACHLKMNCDDCEGWECVCVPLRKQIGYFCDLPTDKRRDDCPLVPVPPHGRLIDADALTMYRTTEWFCGKKRINVPWEAIEAAPTIIPAEPGEEEIT